MLSSPPSSIETDDAGAPGWTPRDDLPLSLTAYRREIARRQREEAEADQSGIRERCKTFAGFVREAWKVIEPGTPLRWNWHLQAMCDHLEAITYRRITPWIIINVPPGSSKSTIVSVLWQAWEWGPCGLRHLKYVSTSFEEGNVTRDTRKCRDLIQSGWYGALWPDVLEENGKLKRQGETSFANGSTGFREGVTFAGLTGKRGDRVVIDDPHSVRGADSEKDRNRATREFLEGGLNRTNDVETSAMVVVMQRLHEDDLTGVLLARDLGFIHLCIPMEFEVARRCRTPLQVPDPEQPGKTKDWTDPRSYEGELMDPTRFPRTAVDRQKKAGEYSWNGQYQQRPAPREGGMFKVDRIGMISSDPGGGKVVRGWDIAATKRKTSAYTVGLKLRRVDGRFIIIDVKRDKLTPSGVKKLALETTINDGHDCLQSFPKDPGAAGVAVKDDFADMLAGHNFRFSAETGDKETRAFGVSSTIESETMDMVVAPWNAELKEELRNFPNGSFKDQVDALSRAYSELVGGPAEIVNAGPEIVEVGDITTIGGVEGWDGVEDDPWSGL